MSRVAILGVGKVGTAIARAAMAGGHEVILAGSGSPEPVQFIVDVMAPGAKVAAASEAVVGSDLVILAIPLPKVESLDPEMLAGRIVVDAMNHWEPTDGALPAVFDGATSTSEVVAEVVASFGFDLTAAAPLALGTLLEPGTEIFGGSFSDTEIKQRISSADGVARLAA